MSKLTTTLGAAIVAALGAATAPQALALGITREFSSAWYDPAHAGHGFLTDVIDGGNGQKTLVAYWFTYDAQGRQIWVIGTGPVVGDHATLAAFTTSGGSFDNTFNPANVQQQPWGTLQVSFSGCNAGSVDFIPANPALPRGRIDVMRLTSRFNSVCSGGISDDRVSTGADQAVVRFMQATAAAPGASGKLSFEQRSDRTDFKAEAEDVPSGTYALRVAGIERGSFTVSSVANGTNGEIEFRSPVEPGKHLLDFDPRDQLVEVVRNGTVFLTSNFSTTTPPPGGGGGAPPTGNGLYALVVEPAGNDGPELHAELELRSGRADFSVEVEDVPAGSYGLRIGGQPHGSISVVAIPGGTNGELEFRNPVEPGKQLLDFDPRGQLVEITGTSSVLLSGLFPSQPTGPLDDGGGSGGGGNDDPPGDDNGGGTGGGSGGGSGGGGTGGGGSGVGIFDVVMTSSGADSDANGSLHYQGTTNEREFEVEAQDLSDGSYTVRVAGTVRATMTVSRGRGQVRFADPARAGRELLDFNPRGQLTEIVGGSTVFLSGRLP